MGKVFFPSMAASPLFRAVESILPDAVRAMNGASSEPPLQGREQATVMTHIDAHLHAMRQDETGHTPTDHGHSPPQGHGLAEVRPLLEDIAGAVLVRTAPTDAETVHLLKIARESEGLVRGVIGWVDLTAPDAPDRIGELARDPLLKGLRPSFKEIGNSYWIMRDEVKPALRAMERAGLRLDAAIEQRHFPVIPMLRMFHPDLGIVVDHAAPLFTAPQEFRAWADGLKRLAIETDVCCRLSGLPVPPGTNWMMNDLRPWAEHIMDSFGPTRVMWGSDWPILDLTSEYIRWHRIVTRYLFRYDLRARDEIMGGTATRFFGLDKGGGRRGYHASNDRMIRLAASPVRTASATPR